MQYGLNKSCGAKGAFTFSSEDSSDFFSIAYLFLDAKDVNAISKDTVACVGVCRTPQEFRLTLLSQGDLNNQQ